MNSVAMCLGPTTNLQQWLGSSSLSDSELAILERIRVKAIIELLNTSVHRHGIV